MILLTIGLSGCNEQSDEDKLIGTWIYTMGSETATISYTFFSDKTFIITAPNPYDGEEVTVNGTWIISGNTIVLTSHLGTKDVGEYNFSKNNETLTITKSHGDTVVLTKK